MSLSAAQVAQYKAVIKADILANFPGQTDAQIVAAYNAIAVPAFTVWKTNVSKDAVAQQGFISTELAGLSSLNTQRLQNLAAWFSSLNPSVASIRAFFDDIFSGAGGVLTRASLLTLWKRDATRLEKLLATGTGSTSVPATLGFEGTISEQNVSDIVNG